MGDPRSRSVPEKHEPYSLAMAVAGTDELSAPVPTQTSRTRLPWRLAAFAMRAYWLWPALLMLAAAGYRLGTPSLWADELATWGAVRLRWGQLFHLVGNVDAVVAPYYVVTKAWAAVAGTSPAALRMPSVLAMVGSAALVAILGARLHSRWVGLLAGLIFALAPTTSRYAQEARPYAFAILFAIVATLLLTWFVERPTAGTGLAYALAVALLAAFHVIGLLLLLAHGPAARGRRKAWAVWAGIGVLPVLPLMWLGYRQRDQVRWIPPASMRIVLGAPDVIFVSAGVGGALVALGLLAFARRRNAVLLVTWALVPAVALAVIGQFAPLFYARYLLFVVPAWVLLAALTLDRLPRAHALAVVLGLALLGAPTQNGIRAGNGHPTASADAGNIIAANDLPGDAIAYQLDDTAPWEARDVVSRYVPADRRPLDVFEVTPQRISGRLAATECADLAACLDRADPARMWILRKDTRADPLQGIGSAKENLLRARYRLSRLWLVRGLTIALYVRG
jgi:mannosyltransferase